MLRGLISTTFVGARSFATTSGESVGFIGLGNMGGPMAKNLIKHGHKVVVFDVSQASVDNLVKAGASAAKSPAAVASQVKTLVSMVPSSPHVKSVYEGKDGILSTAAKGTMCIDASTISPHTAREVSKAAAAKGVTFLDAPVSGGTIGAEAGTLTFMVGGSAGDFERAKAVLKCMGANIVHCGDVGNGQVTKICNNLVLGISMVATAEAMNLGVKLGMDPKVLAGVFNTSSARCWSSEKYNPCPGVMEGVPASRGFTGGFGSALMAKDLNLALEAGLLANEPLPMGATATQVYRLMVANGYGSKDFSSVWSFLQKKDL